MATKTRFLLISFVLFSLGLGSAAEEEEEIATIDVLKAHELIRSGNYGYLDVRTEEEFKKGHVDVENPLNIAYMFNTPQGRVKNPNFLEEVLALCNKDAHLIVGCQSGVRSVYATIDLQNTGYKHLYNMGGGYLAWVDNGLPVTKIDYLTTNLTKEQNEVKADKAEKKNLHLRVIVNESEIENDLTGTVKIANV